jgi:hypothetical protein
VQLLQAFLRQEVARDLEISPPETVALDQALGELGMDSLIVVGFCDRLSRSLGVPVSTTIVFDHPTIVEMARHLAESRLGWFSNDAEPRPPEDPAVAVPGPASVAELSAEEVERLLAAEVEGIHG